MKREIVGIDSINYLSLRNYILDRRLSEEDTIVLNQLNFDNLILEYRELYNESMPIPHLLLGVLIREAKDDSERILFNNLLIIREDTKSVRYIEQENENNYYDGEVFYRCGWCGNVVESNGMVLEGYERSRAINYIENYPFPIVKHIDGLCCRR
ncbi:hypothetical protein [Sphingobacterium kyonggiense]